MPKAFELRAQRKQYIEKARAILTLAETEKRSMSDTEVVEYNVLLTDADKRKVEADRVENLDGLEQEVKAGGSRELGALPHQVQTRHRYSMVRALRQRLAQVEGTGRLDGLEGEVHQELQKRRGVPSRGVLIPFAMGPEPETRADLTTTTGVGSIATILDANLIELLRPRMVTAAAGATVMSDMHGLFAIPRQNAAGTFAWVAEGSSITTSGQTIDQVPFSPKTGGVLTNYTRRFLEQTNQDAEAFVRRDQMALIARGVETAAFNGLGSGSNQPVGILQNTAIATLVAAAGLSSGTNGGVLTYANLILLEQAVATANADMGKLAYITDAAVRGHMKRTLKVASSTFPLYLWDGGPTPVNEYACPITNLLPNNLTKGSGTALHPLIYGNWEDLFYAFWSGMDVVVDPYTGAAAGSVRIVTLQDVDVNVRHPESFVYLNDITPT